MLIPVIIPAEYDNMDIDDVPIGQTFIQNSLEYLKISETCAKLVISVYNHTIH